MEIGKKDYIEALSDNVEKQFTKRLVEKQKEYVKRHKPFCYRCALIDFRAKLDRTVRESQTLAETSEGNLNIPYEDVAPKDLDVYGNPDRFKLLKNEEVEDVQVVAGARMPQLIAIRQVFQCTIRKCGHAVEVPLKLWENRTKQDWKKLDEEDDNKIIIEESKEAKIKR